MLNNQNTIHYCNFVIARMISIDVRCISSFGNEAPFRPKAVRKNANELNFSRISCNKSDNYQRQLISFIVSSEANQ